MFENFFNFSGKGEKNNPEALKSEEQNNEEINDEKVKKEEKTPEENDPMKGMSLEERLRVLEEKKAEVESLKDKRRNFYIDAKNLEEKMLALGLSEEKAKEIREQILAEGGGIATQISDIKKDYGLEATPVEIYSSRYKDCEAEIERSKKAIALDYREALEIAEKTKETAEKRGYGYVYTTGSEAMADVMSLVFDRLRSKGLDKKLPETMIDFIKSESNKKTSFSNSEEIEVTFKTKLNELIEMLNEKISTESIYKTPGDIEAAKKRLERLNYILVDTDSLLRDAMKKEGRFVDEKK